MTFTVRQLPPASKGRQKVIFSVCPHLQGVTPICWWGVPHPADRGYPHPIWKGGYPKLPEGVTPIWLTGVYPIWLMGVTPIWLTGVPPSGLDGSNPPPPQLGLDGVPLPHQERAAERAIAIRRAVCLLEDFLDKKLHLPVCPPSVFCTSSLMCLWRFELQSNSRPRR